MVKIGAGDPFDEAFGQHDKEIQGLSVAFDQAFDVEPPKEEKKLSTCGVLVKTWKDFLADTNIDGLNNAGRSKQRFRTFIWFLIFTIGVLLTVRDVKDLMEDYLSYPVDVSTTLSHENSVPFPSVTVCNKNRVSCKRLEMLKNKCEENDEMCEHPKAVDNIVKGSKCGKERNKRGVEISETKQRKEKVADINTTETKTKPNKNQSPNSQSETDSTKPNKNLSKVVPDTSSSKSVENTVKTVKNKPKTDTTSTNTIKNDNSNDKGPTKNIPANNSKVDKTISKRPKASQQTNNTKNEDKNMNSKVPTKNQLTNNNESKEPTTKAPSKIKTSITKKKAPTNATTKNKTKVPQSKKEERRIKNRQKINMIFGNSSKVNFNRIKKSKPSTVDKKKRSKDLKYRLRNMKISKIVEEEHEFLKDYMELSKMERMMIGHDYDDLVKSCTFRGVDCTDEMNVTVTSTPGYGNCFTIGAEDEDFARSSLTGAIYGLSLVLNIEAEQYQRGGQTQANGARMSIQDQSSLPLIEEYGLDVAPHTQTSVALQLIYIARQTSPYPSNCTGNDWAKKAYREHLAQEDKDYYRYSLSLCQRLCLQQTFQDDCQCSHPLYGEGNNENRKRPCQLVKDSKDRECVNNIITEYDTGERKCECSPSCEEIDFEKLVSSTVWPGHQYIPVIQKEFNIEEEKIESNLLRIDVYFMSLNVKFIIESPRYKFVEFISILGGAFGVWVGFSVCVLFEVVELVVDVFINVLTH